MKQDVKAVKDIPQSEDANLGVFAFVCLFFFSLLECWIFFLAAVTKMFTNMSVSMSSFMSVLALVDGKLRETDAETKVQMRARRASTILAVKIADLPLDSDLEVELLFKSPWRVRAMVQILCEIPWVASEWSVWALNCVFTKRYQAMNRFPPLS